MTNCISAKKYFSNYIKEYRTKQGWSRTKLADMMGVSASTVSNWEAGLAMPDYDKLCFLADLFYVTTDELLGRIIEEGDESNRDIDNINRTSDLDIWTKYECCDEIGQASIKNCIQFHYNRCTDGPDEEIYYSTKRIEQLFLSPNDAEYDTMDKKMAYLKMLRKNSKKSFMDITTYLWNLGYGGEICLAFVLDMFGRGVNKRVPCQKLYDDIEAFLKDEYEIVPHKKRK